MYRGHSTAIPAASGIVDHAHSGDNAGMALGKEDGQVTPAVGSLSKYMEAAWDDELIFMEG